MGRNDDSKGRREIGSFVDAFKESTHIVLDVVCRYVCLILRNVALIAW